MIAVKYVFQAAESTAFIYIYVMLLCSFTALYFEEAAGLVKTTLNYVLRDLSFG